MARQSGIFNMDGGLWFDVKSAKGIGVTNVVGAARYLDLSDFQTLLTNGTTWNSTPWGDQAKRLVDSRYGYKIVDSFWTEPKIDDTPYTASALASNPIGGNIVIRSFVLKSLDTGKYIYVKSGTEGNPAASVQFSYVTSHHEAYRFTNFTPVIAWITGSVLGDGTAGFALEQYYFTKAVTTTSYSFFAGPATLSNAVERAFVPFSKEKGKYLVVDDLNLPPAQMSFSFTPDVYAGTRFTDLNDFQDILDQTILGSEAYGWQVPQFVFTREAKPPKENPFQLFWCIEGNYPDRFIFGDTCGFLCMKATEKSYINDWYSYLNDVGWQIINSKNYSDRDVFDRWWGQQDINDFLRWLYELYIECGGQGKQ
jgi:hypothetical protein